MPVQPFPEPGAAPDEPPFWVCRFNIEWRGFVLGAVQDAIDRRGVIDYVDDTYDLDPQPIDSLLEQIMTPVATSPIAPNAEYHPFLWRDVGGSWTAGLNNVYPYWPYLYNDSGNVGDAIRISVFLPAGDYSFRWQFGRSVNGGRARINWIIDGETENAGYFDLYNAATIYNQMDVEQRSFGVDLNGFIEIKAEASPSPHQSAKQIIFFNLWIVRL